jgi:hypothetical protein
MTVPGVKDVLIQIRDPLLFPDATFQELCAQCEQVRYACDHRDKTIQKGKAGEPTFYASENGRTVGTADTMSTFTWRVDGSLWDRHFCPGCNGSCVGTDVRCSQSHA